ncbi:MAG: Gfo/Idh/MocA family oxidoreductase [Firmicutes bacterium]|nr:Gfo/Idh/MocA family oxidoreductase [Bacillota bacterium]
MIKVGIIGIGNMGSSHARKIFGGEVPGMELAAVCDTNPERISWAKDTFGDSVGCFADSDEFYKNASLFDLVIIATPHYSHPSLAITAFDNNLHVLVEKPAGVYTKQVREMNEAAKKTDKKFFIMYNQRTNCVYRKLKDLIQGGELGDLKRMVWIITSWYRPQAYHDSSAWRSTWEGEGGGVLLNQDPHQLDLWQWLVGMPKRIRAFASFGKYYDIEVEDDVTAYAEYDNGMTATFITATGEAPGTNRLEISGTMGKIVVENNDITFYRNRVDEREFNKANKAGFGIPEVWKCAVSTDGKYEGHVGILKNIVDVIKNNAQPIAEGVEGILGLSISNAMHLSAWTDSWVELDKLDEELFYDTLQSKIKNSKFKKRDVKEKTFDVGGSH